MLEHLLQITPLCFMIAVVAVVYMRILANEPILSKWFALGSKYGAYTEQVQGGYRLAYRWWYKPLFQCEKCLAGQLGLWSYLCYMGEWHRGPVWFYFLGSFKHPVHLIYWTAPNYDLICHLYTICGSVALAIILSSGWNIFKRKQL